MTAADAAAARTAADAQVTLVSGTNIKTVNSTSLLGSGNIVVSASPAGSSGQLQYNNAGAFGGTTAMVYAGTGTHVVITAQAAATIPLAIQGAASQSGNLTEWRNSSGTPRAWIDSNGDLRFSLSRQPTIYCGANFGAGLAINVEGTVFVTIRSDSIVLANTYSIFWGSNTIPRAAVKTPAAGRLQLCSGTSGISNDAVSLEVDNSSTAGDTRMLLYDVTSATMKRVSVGAADSGGAGFKVLRVPN